VETWFATRNYIYYVCVIRRSRYIARHSCCSMINYPSGYTTATSSSARIRRTNTRSIQCYRYARICSAAICTQSRIRSGICQQSVKLRLDPTRAHTHTHTHTSEVQRDKLAAPQPLKIKMMRSDVCPWTTVSPPSPSLSPLRSCSRVSKPLRTYRHLNLSREKRRQKYFRLSEVEDCRLLPRGEDFREDAEVDEKLPSSALCGSSRRKKRSPRNREGLVRRGSVRPSPGRKVPADCRSKKRHRAVTIARELSLTRRPMI